LLPNPVSVRNILGRTVDLKDVLYLLCNHLEKRYLQLKAGQAKEIKAAYLKSLYRYNETHTFEYGGQKFKAKIVDVGEDGKLVLEYGNNLTGRYDFKTIHFVLNEKDS
jgi:BirA family biotin operon repressor/biotin-[acetyl-CoA-carboxylase] ligase